MKKIFTVCLYSFFFGAAVFFWAMVVASWGKISSLMESLIILAGLGLTSLSASFWYRTDPQIRKISGIGQSPYRKSGVYGRAPVIASYLSVVAGVFLPLIIYYCLVH